MKRLISFIVTSFIIQSTFCQINSLDSWIININIGIEAHDKRLFNYSERESLLEMQPEYFGTYNFEFNFSKRILNKKKSSSFLGIGSGQEKATFLRPFDHSHFMKDSLRILRNHDSYSKVKVFLSLKVFYELKDNLFASGVLTSNFLLYRSIDNNILNSDLYPFSESTFELDDINLNVGINYKIKNLIIGFDLRILNFQKIDKLLFNRIIKDPRTDQTWELDNPISGRLSIGYIF